MKRIRWIHFSDLHLNETGVETNRLRAKLPQYLESLNIKCDYAFCTGDIRYAPMGEFPDDSVQYLHKICASVNVPVEKLFMVPGNHDIDCFSEGRDTAVKEVFCGEKNSGYYKTDTGKINDNELMCIANGKKQFNAVIEKVYSGADNRTELYNDAVHPHFLITTEHLNIVHLDTTLNFTLSQKRDMIIGTDLLMRVLEKADKTKPTVVLTHFSSDFLFRGEQEQLVLLLKDYGVKLWFAGHEHSHICRKQWDWFYEFQCGNLLLEQGAKACVILGELDLDTLEGEISVHAWFEKGGWAKYPFVRTATQDNSFYPFSLNLLDQNEEYSAERRNLIDCLNMQSAEGGQFSDLEFNADLVPDLSCNGQIYTTADGVISLVKATDSLWNGSLKRNNSQHALLLGDGGMGKSTMLYHTCSHFVKNCNRLAIFASIQALQASETKIEDYILSSLYKSTESKYKDKLYALLSKQYTSAELVLFVDGFNELSSESTYRYVAELKLLSQFPGIQIIVSSRLDFLRNFGMVYFETIRTNDLRGEQIKTLFSEAEWANISNKHNLRILLKNPMMTLLYAQTCPVIERHRELEYCDWKTVSSVTDLLHNYYMAQVALMADRVEVNGGNIFKGLCLLNYVMPLLGYTAEKSGVTVFSNDKFQDCFDFAVGTCNAMINGGVLPNDLRLVKRIYGLKTDIIDPDELYELLIKLMCLLKWGPGKVSFPHQIFRDYMAAKYLYSIFLSTESVTDEWKNRISESVLQYMRNMYDNPWQKGGLIDNKIWVYRGKEKEDKDHFIENVINCWLPKDIDKNIDRDLSRLDLRQVSLAEHLKCCYNGTINIDGAMVSKQTFVNDEHHDNIIGLSFSHDGKTIAAVSSNGLVSVSNIDTQSQMVVGRIQVGSNAQIGFNDKDLLLVISNNKTWLWPTISYDKFVEANNEKIYKPQNIHGADSEEKAIDMQKLHAMLVSEDLLDGSNAISADCNLLASGSRNGLIQVWRASDCVCIAEFSLGDSRICTAAFSPSGRYAALSAGGKIVQLWDAKGVKLIDTIHLKKPVRKVRFPETSDYLECEYSDGKYTKISTKDGTIEECSSLRKIIQIKNEIRKMLGELHIRKIDIADDGNAIIMLNKSKKIWIWNNKQKKMNTYDKFGANVVDVAMCNADSTYAAGFSDEIMPSNRTVPKTIQGKKIVRTFATRIGNCMERLPTAGRTIRKLRFFTTNRIILAGFATNGDILMWELRNITRNGVKYGHWHYINILKNRTAEPVECAITDSKDFLGAYEDGKIMTVEYGSNNSSAFYVFPGIDLTCLKWNELICGDYLKNILNNYKMGSTQN